MATTVSISISIAGIRTSISPAGLQTVLDALEVGADDFGQTDTDEAEAAEMEAWGIIKLMRRALEGADEADADAIAEARGFEMGKKARRLDESLGLAEPFASEAREALHNAGCSG